jgi:hypothetical protein
MKKRILGISTALAMLGGGGLAHADLWTIGTAQFDEAGTVYNLIYDTGISAVWLDYTNHQDTWHNQNSWTTGLGEQLAISIDPNKWIVDWGDTTWRLPTGTINEYSHLFREELGWNLTDRSNTAEFENLQVGFYWTSTPFYDHPFDYDLAMEWNNEDFTMWHQDVNYDNKALALRNVSVIAMEPVPEPATMILFGTGLAGLVGLRIRKQTK